MKNIKLSVPIEDSGKRIDVFIHDALGGKLGLSRSAVQKLIKNGEVKLNLSEATVSHYKINENDLISFVVPRLEKSTLEPENIKLKILYEDKFLLVLDKPVGLVVHPGAGNKSATLVNALLNHTKKLSTVNRDRPGIVHRLDKGTYGLMMVAKDNKTHLAIAEQFARHEIRKNYVALVKGLVEFDEGEIDVPIGKDQNDFKKMKAEFSADAREAKTIYRVLARSKNYTMLDLSPLTGRTHQLRVHLDYLGHPILGDEKYSNGKGFKRMFLHAYKLVFFHPAQKKSVEFKIKIPKEFYEVVDKDKTS